MREADLDRVMAIADSLMEAPHWPRGAYVAALRPESAPRRIALVAEQEAAIAGFVVASVVATQAELESIAVEGKEQGRGIGGALLAQLIAELRLAGVDELDLEVRESNRAARRLYERAGFREVGRRRGYYQEPFADAILLRLGLS
jgi:ribosomal-protein-alanine N-acetyltransferase